MSGTTNVHEVSLPSALDATSVGELLGALRMAPAGGVVVLRGGETFCDGMALANVIDEAPAKIAVAVHGFAEVLAMLRSLAQPLIAVVEGPARGGGVGLAAVCDVVIASDTASFSLPEALFGLTPAIVGPFVEARVGAPAFRRMVLTAEARSAEQARRMGLVDEVCAETMPAVVRRYVRALGRTGTVAAGLRRAHPSRGELGRAARQTLGRLRDPAVLAKIRAFANDGLAPWEATAS